MNEPDPPVTVAVAVPSLSPLQVTGVAAAKTDKFLHVPGFTVTDVVAVHPLASVTVTV